MRHETIWIYALYNSAVKKILLKQQDVQQPLFNGDFAWKNPSPALGLEPTTFRFLDKALQGFASIRLTSLPL